MEYGPSKDAEDIAVGDRIVGRCGESAQVQVVSAVDRRGGYLYLSFANSDRGWQSYKMPTSFELAPSSFAFTEHRAGELAFIDSFAGLILCKVISVSGYGKVTVRVTAHKGAYKRGEVLTEDVSTIVPRSAVRVSSGRYRIRNNYLWLVAADEDINA